MRACVHVCPACTLGCACLRGFGLFTGERGEASGGGAFWARLSLFLFAVSTYKAINSLQIRANERC
jgi:hypothetical protein